MIFQENGLRLRKLAILLIFLAERHFPAVALTSKKRIKQEHSHAFSHLSTGSCHKEQGQHLSIAAVMSTLFFVNPYFIQSKYLPS